MRNEILDRLKDLVVPEHAISIVGELMDDPEVLARIFHKGI